MLTFSVEVSRLDLADTLGVTAAAITRSSTKSDALRGPCMMPEAE